MLKPIFMTARDIPDLWFQLVRAAVEQGREYVVTKGSTPTKRWELDFVSAQITHPGTRPLEPDIPPGIGIPNPVESGYAEKYLPYYMTDVSQPGEHYCYDDETEILTDQGWKLFKDLNRTEKVATLNPVTEQLEYQTPADYHSMDYSGKMYSIKSFHIDLKVTPGHSLYISQNKVAERYIPFSLIKIEDINNYRIKFKKDCIWSGRDHDFFNLPATEYQNPRYKGYGCERKIPMDLWLKFFGIWLAEGSLRRYKNRNVYFITITQYPGKERDKIAEVLKSIFSSVSIFGKDLIVADKQIYSYLEQFGKAGDKFIPKELMNLSRRQLKILFDWMYLGDGDKCNGDYVRYTTKSEFLANQVQELCLKIGLASNIRADSGVYRVYINKKNTPHILKDKNITVESYTGKVYCVKVSKYHTLYVRRNGTACWCGNTYGQDLAWQIEWIIAYYKKHGPGTKHCYMTVGRPESLRFYDDSADYAEEINISDRATGKTIIKRSIDNVFNKSMPGTTQCLRGIDTSVKYGKLHFSIHFRSWNLWNGLPANLCCLQMVKEYMAEQIGVEDGEMFITCLKLGLAESCFDIAKLRLYMDIKK
ncbi:LAGLIDADG family homing endonuclease [Desulfonema magnum]|uniref:LAGLIDADG-like domain-containing protein n=1 Tax=Desulfonema magnum TaxID=45655 RepID=A0A975GKK4_9BACT|nr:LAGLIDADG family homing endonuclease [Desulfonema magnum]QTA84732.1 LAGLIDADG-like domain-containing protein [Desulfonema magnum]